MEFGFLNSFYMGKRKRIYIISGITAVLCIISAIAIVHRYVTDYQNNVPINFSLYITPETTYKSLIDTLKCHLKNIHSFERCFSRENPDFKLHAGHYLIKESANNKSIARAITNGWQTPIRLTLSGNIRGINRLCGILGKKLMYDSTAFSNYLNSGQSADRYGFNEDRFASMFIPNTYEVYWSITPEDFAKRMKKEYDNFWNESRKEKAKRLNMTQVEVSILASIVCEESNYIPEMPDIAGVYINRLNRGMKLEADPTVKFALKDPSLKRILYKHLKVDSPYNTYLYRGLPPGPITIPSIAGIDAVLNYRKHNYLFFCADAKLNGTHKFARTLSEHNRNARAYQVAISKLNSI